MYVNFENRKYQYILVSNLDHQVRVVDDRRVFRELLVGDCPLLELLCWVNTHRWYIHKGQKHTQSDFKKDSFYR